MKQFLITLGLMGEELKEAITLETLSTIIGNVDLINLHHNTFTRIDVANRCIPLTIDNHLVEFLKKTLIHIVEHCDKIRSGTSRRIEIHSIDLLCPNDWFYIQINYLEKEALTKQTILGKIKTIKEDSTDYRDIRKKLDDLEDFITLNWSE